MSTAEPEMKLDKSDVNFGGGHRASNCGICKWFMRKQESCKWVKGKVLAGNWCELFHRDAG